MLTTILLLAVTCIAAIEAIFIEVLWTKLKRSRQHAESWKLACASLERDRDSW